MFFISGGKDSCYNMMQCVEHGHVIVALANLKPTDGGKVGPRQHGEVSFLPTYPLPPPQILTPNNNETAVFLLLPPLKSPSEGTKIMLASLKKYSDSPYDRNHSPYQGGGGVRNVPFYVIYTKDLQCGLPYYLVYWYTIMVFGI